MTISRQLKTRLRMVVLMILLGSLPATAVAAPEILPDPDDSPPDTTKPVKVYFLSGQSNMCGMGRQETLKPLAEGDEKFGYLLDDNGNWTVRKDVHYIYYVMDKRHNDGPLTVFNRIGPELGIGHVLGHEHDEMVLLIKGACGNRSLGFDFMPPSSRKRLGKPMTADGWYAGTSYDRYVKHAKNVLANLEGNLPGYKGQGYELAGIFWWQGHKDKGMAKETYEQFLVELINDFRADFEAPDAKFVLATVAFNGHNLGAWQGVWEAQMAVSDWKRHPDFKENVASVDIRDIGGGGFHYGDNGATYAKVGDAMGRAMAYLLQLSTPKQPDRTSKASAAAPMPEGLDEQTISPSLRPALKGLAQRKYRPVLLLLDRVEKTAREQQAKPDADLAALHAELKDVETIRTFVDQQVADALAQINTYVAADNPYRAKVLITTSNRWFRGVEKYDAAVNPLQKSFLTDPNRSAIRQGTRFYQLLAATQRVRDDRTITMLADFASRAGDTTYGKAARTAVDALKQDPQAQLDGDELVAGVQ